MVGRASKFRCRRSTSRIDTFSKMESQRTGSITKRYRCTEAILRRTDPVHISLSSSSYRRCLCCAHGVAALPCISSNLFAQTSQLAAGINLSSASEEPVCLRSNVNDNDDDNAQPVPQDEEEEETEEEDENKTREEKEEEEKTLKETKKRQAWNSHERTTSSSWIDEENNRRSRAWRKTIFASEVRFDATNANLSGETKHELRLRAHPFLRCCCCSWRCCCCIAASWTATTRCFRSLPAYPFSYYTSMKRTGSPRFASIWDPVPSLFPTPPQPRVN